MTGNQLRLEIKKLNKTQEEAAQILGVTRRTLNNWFALDGFDANTSQIVKLKLGINLSDDKITSKGEANSDETVITGKVIPLYDAEAAAGTSYGMSMEPAHPISMIEIGGLLKDSESALRVYGNSMTPNYPAGCVVGLRPHTDSFIEPGCVYVIETNENRYLKRLYYNDSKTAFQCLSDNHMMHEAGPRTGKSYYPEFEIPFEDVRKLFRVVGVIKRNIL